MVEMNREQLVEKIAQTKKEMKTAGPVHYRDLRKHLNRMLVQLRRYDAFQAAARQGVG